MIFSRAADEGDVQTSVTPGWYPDPWIAGNSRWWTGHDWTHQSVSVQQRTPIELPELPSMTQRLSAWINAHGHHRDRDPALTNENAGDRVEA
jgi:hypothetical protein